MTNDKVVFELKLQDVEGNWGWYRYNPEFDFETYFYYRHEFGTELIDALEKKYNAEVRVVKLL